MFADGVLEAQRINDGFATPELGAAYWREGAKTVSAEDLTYPGGAGQAQVARLYNRAEGVPLLLFIHGGGWAGGSIDLNDRACSALAADTGWQVLSISYRLAPAHPFPAGLDDCRAALAFVRAGGLGATPVCIAAGGASAGGNLALCLALAESGLDGLLLFYPVCGSDFATASYVEYADGFGLSRARMKMLFDMVDPEAEHRRNPLLVPLAGDLTGLPTTHIISAELDVLADDSRQLAERLTHAKVPHTLHIEPGVTHGFINRGRLIPAADTCLSLASARLITLKDPQT
ncbi:alpha/beta hydrolase [Tropicibacter sp. S64]|uniref:alpha/beta hydrolase n=1 Tax=Tropicibacter sp. S64 TaxID=3415122 RepID=UPI003C7E51D8